MVIVSLKKPNNIDKWEYIPTKNVISAWVRKDDKTVVDAWNIQKDIKKVNSGYGGTGINSTSQSNTNIEPVKSKEIVRFTLNDDMSDIAPFGESVLRTVYKVYKQKELLEDSVIIYRIQRAPERRVFYIDVGKMPTARVQKYLEQLKNEIKQKKIPSMNGGKSEIDSVYNPQSMQEDYFFAQKSDGKGSRVETLPGGEGLGELSDLGFFQEKLFRGLRVPSSYMTGNQEGAIYNDGKVGIAYVQEQRFAAFVERLQTYIESVLDVEFKKYLRTKHINIDPTIFEIRLPESANFSIYKQQELDAALLGNYASVQDSEFLSKRFVMKRYLGLSDEDIALNEQLLKEEKGLDKSKPHVQKIYGGIDDFDEGGGEFTP